MVQLELELVMLLGKGTSGSVSLYLDRCTSILTAVKTSDQKHAVFLHLELKILSQFKGCSRIVQSYENRLIKNLDAEGNIQYMMLMEYACGGSLSTFMDLFKDKKLPDPCIRSFTRMLLEGLATIHSHGYVHCDLKPENILVFPIPELKDGEIIWSYEVKISDFGLSKRDGDNSWWSPSHTCVGTPVYMSPASVSHGVTGKDLDLWSLGCVVLEMYTGKKPWWHTNYDLKDLMNCYEPLIPQDLPLDARIFITTCFSLETDERRTALRLLQYGFLHGVESRVPVLMNVPRINHAWKHEEDGRAYGESH